MIGLDTNVLVRYLAQDDARQSPRATRLIESLTSAQPGFVSHVVPAETVWVLESCYGADARKIAEVIDTLLRIDGLVVDRADIVWQALREFTQRPGDFPDVLIAAIARSAGCASVQTFDQGAARRAGMTLLG